ncbi:MAG: SAM-dependent methyltransferase [Chloroflexota bacterium]
MSPESIIDDTKPNAGRMYDYYLGGFHNFAIDRQAADQVLKLLPFARKFVRLQRWCLQDIAEELDRRGYDVIVDFASGLPTNDHIHHRVSSKTTVIYSDSDPVVVEYALEILKSDFSNVYCFKADARHPEELLERPDVQQILNGRRKVAFVYWGVSAFLTDADLTHALKYLYEWADSGSCLAFNAQLAGVNPEDPASMEVAGIYTRMGTPVFLRSLEQYQELLGNWRLNGVDFVSLLNWHGFDQSELSEDDVSVYGPMGGGFGAYLIKP